MYVSLLAQLAWICATARSDLLVDCFGEFWLFAWLKKKKGGARRRMKPQDREYFRARAESELKMAENASCEEAARAHYQIAGLYFDRAYSPAERLHLKFRPETGSSGV